MLAESHGPYGHLDLRGLVLGSGGAFTLVFGLIRAQTLGWGASSVVASLAAGLALLGAFVAVERRTAEPMLPMAFFARRSFAVTNVVSLTMYFGMFGSIFFLSQFMQNVLGNSPLQAGLKLLVWTGATMVVAPFAGVFSERIGSRPFMAAGLALQGGALAWLAATASTHMHYAQMIAPFVMAGAGMALVFAPSANAVLSSVRDDQAGQASGANNAIREIGGVLGVAVLASVFTSAGGYGSPQAFVDGMIPALWVGVGVLAAGMLVTLAFPFGRRSHEEAKDHGRGRVGARLAGDAA
jgi:predicted MFS family arabinose efflux permease